MIIDKNLKLHRKILGSVERKTAQGHGISAVHYQNAQYKGKQNTSKYSDAQMTDAFFSELTDRNLIIFSFHRYGMRVHETFYEIHPINYKEEGGEPVESGKPETLVIKKILYDSGQIRFFLYRKRLGGVLEYESDYLYTPQAIGGGYRV